MFYDDGVGLSIHILSMVVVQWLLPSVDVLTAPPGSPTEIPNAKRTFLRAISNLRTASKLSLYMAPAVLAADLQAPPPAPGEKPSETIATLVLRLPVAAAALGGAAGCGVMAPLVAAKMAAVPCSAG